MGRFRTAGSVSRTEPRIRVDEGVFGERILDFRGDCRIDWFATQTGCGAMWFVGQTRLILPSEVSGYG